MQIFSKLAQDNSFKVMLKAVYEGYLEAITAVFERGVQLGCFPPQNTKNKALQYMALLDSLLIYSTMGFAVEDQVQLIESAIMV